MVPVVLSNRPNCKCQPKSGSCVIAERKTKKTKRKIKTPASKMRSLIVLLYTNPYNESMKITNRKASFDYQLLDRFEAGINLFGAEVKAVREGHVDLSGSFVRVIGNEAYLV